MRRSPEFAPALAAVVAAASSPISRASPSLPSGPASTRPAGSTPPIARGPPSSLTATPIASTRSAGLVVRHDWLLVRRARLGAVAGTARA
jgi:hypothetical protein